MMRNIFKTFFLALGAALLLNACDAAGIDDPEIPDGPESIVGSWHLQSLTVETETTINGSVHTNSSVTDFTKENCRLVLGKNHSATAQFNFEVEIGAYSYDPETSTIRFKNGLSVSDNGKAMVLVKDYTVEVDDITMVLIQKDLSIGLGSLFSGNERAIYHFRREKSEQ